MSCSSDGRRKKNEGKGAPAVDMNPRERLNVQHPAEPQSGLCVIALQLKVSGPCAPAGGAARHGARKHQLVDDNLAADGRDT